MGGTKGSSRMSSPRKDHVSNTKGAGRPNPLKDGKKNTPVSTWAQNEVNKFKRGDNLYNGLINIIADPEYLKACYIEIKSKPGNMTKWTNNITLDGINNE